MKAHFSMMIWIASLITLPIYADSHYDKIFMLNGIEQNGSEQNRWLKLAQKWQKIGNDELINQPVMIEKLITVFDQLEMLRAVYPKRRLYDSATVVYREKELFEKELSFIVDRLKTTLLIVRKLNIMVPDDIELMSSKDLVNAYPSLKPYESMIRITFIPMKADPYSVYVNMIKHSKAGIHLLVASQPHIRQVSKLYFQNDCLSNIEVVGDRVDHVDIDFLQKAHLLLSLGSLQ